MPSSLTNQAERLDLTPRDEDDLGLRGHVDVPAKLDEVLIEPEYLKVLKGPSAPL